MLEEEAYNQAAALAAKILSRRPLSEKLLREKLREKQVAEPAADYAVERMRQLGALDDGAFAQLVLESYARKGWGMLKIRQEMHQRGVPRDVAQDVLRTFEPNWDAMCAQLDRRLRGDCSDRSGNDRACAALQRRGFSYAEIREAMERYREQCEQQATNTD